MVVARIGSCEVATRPTSCVLAICLPAYFIIRCISCFTVSAICRLYPALKCEAIDLYEIRSSELVNQVFGEAIWALPELKQHIITYYALSKDSTGVGASYAHRLRIVVLGRPTAAASEQATLLRRARV